MKATHKPFWESNVNPITGFKVIRQTQNGELYKATRRKHNAKFRAKNKEQN